MRLLPTKNYQLKTSLRAFTLIELLIVAMIIVLLTTMLVINLEKAQAKARDVQRKADITKIAAAMEMYKVDKKSYIASTPVGNFVVADITVFPPSIFTDYLPVVPTDPVNDATHKYQYKGTTTAFKVRANSETITDESDAQGKAGDFYNATDFTYFQVSSNNVALNW